MYRGAWGHTDVYVGHSDIWQVYLNIWGIQTYGAVQTYGGVQTYTHYIYNPINFAEIKFSSKIHVDTMKMEHSQSGSVWGGCPNNILRYAAATLNVRRSLM